MNELITTAIAEKLRGLLTDLDFHIFTKATEQGIVKPCFFIYTDFIKHKRILNNRFKSSYKYNVIYYPAENDRNLCFEMLERISEGLEFISVGGDLIKGFNKNSSINDFVLTFSIEYIFFSRRENVLEDSNNELMGRLDFDGD